MAAPQRKLRLLIMGAIVAAMLVSAYFYWVSQRSIGWEGAFFGLMLLNAILQYRWGANKPQPDSMMHLFLPTTNEPSGKTTPQ